MSLHKAQKEWRMQIVCFMKQKEIIKLFEKRFKRLRKHYSSLLKDFEEDKIHSFRLEMKKLRAFIRLVNISLPGKKTMKINKKLKSFYNTTGDIRNLQLHQQRISHICNGLLLEKPAGYLQALHNEEVEQKRKARQLAKKISFDQFEEKVLDSIQNKLKARPAQAFVIQKKLALFELLSLHYYHDEDLHDMRKALKDLQYDWIYIDSFTALLPASFAKEKNIENITTKLGNYHDLCIALYFFNSLYTGQVANKPEKESLQALKQQLEWRKEKMKKEACQLLSPLQPEMQRQS